MLRFCALFVCKLYQKMIDEINLWNSNQNINPNIKVVFRLWGLLVCYILLVGGNRKASGVGRLFMFLDLSNACTSAFSIEIGSWARCWPTLLETIACSLKRVVRSRVVCPTLPAGHPGYDIWWTILLRNSIGVFLFSESNAVTFPYS